MVEEKSNIQESLKEESKENIKEESKENKKEESKELHLKKFQWKVLHTSSYGECIRMMKIF